MKNTNISVLCMECGKVSTYPAKIPGRNCAYCGGRVTSLGIMQSKASTTGIPTESQEQQALFQWAWLRTSKYPGIELMHHIPNGGSRSKSEAGRFKAEGVVAGIPDIFLPVARGGYHGLYIEMKRIGGRVSDSQQEIIDKLTEQDYCVEICYGFEAARAAIEKYYTEE